MAAYFGFTISLAAIVGSTVTAIYGSIAKSVRAAADFVMLASAVGFAAFSIIDQLVLKRLAIVFVLLVAFILLLTVGPFGVSDTDFIIEAVNQFFSCFLRPVWELVNKGILFNIVQLWEFLADAINNFFVFFYHRSVVAYEEIVAIAECFELTSNPQYLFDIPGAIWKLGGAIGFGFLSAPRQNKFEPIPRGEWGYHYPLENADSNAVRRFEFDPDYAAQGPAQNTLGTRYPRVDYVVRDFWSQLVRIVEDLGKLGFGIFSKLARPTQEFFPSLYINVEQEESTWREASDIVCRATEFSLFTFLWPYGQSSPSNPLDARQEDRDEATQYLCRLYRVVAEGLSVASLLVNDVLTLNRPLQRNSDSCEAFPADAPTAIEVLLRGFPVVDFFIFPRAESNLNIFRSNIAFCRFVVQIQGQSCGGLASGAFSIDAGPPIEFCPEWTGGTSPLPRERIDYLKLLLSPIFKTVSVLGNPSQDAAFELTLTRTEALVSRWLNFLISDFIFVINAIAYPVSCQIQRTLSVWLGENLPGVIIATLEFAYNDRCAVAVVNEREQDNVFLCFLAMASRASPGTFWTFLCNTVDGLGEFLGTFRSGPDDLQMRCAFRKRELGEPKAAPRAMSWYEFYRIYTPYYAYHLREASHAFDHCFVQKNTSMLVAPRCSSGCAARPCVDAALDCVQDRLVATGKSTNAWIGMLEPGSYVRSAVRAAALGADVWFGCKDGDVNNLFETVNATIDTMRDFSARTATASVVLGGTHARCAEAAAWRNSTVYLQCTGLQPVGATWEETLELHGISSTTLCGALLHVNGIVLNKNSTYFTSTYDGCLTMFAYGANARAQGLTEEPLASFLDGWTLAHAVSSSTEHLKPLPTWNADARTDSWWTEFMLAEPAAPTGARATDALADDKTFRLLHDLSSVAYAYFHYAADVYAEVMAKESTGAQKDEATNRIFFERVVTVVAAVGMQTNSVVQARGSVVRAAAQQESVDNIFRMYGSSLTWVDRLHATPSNTIARNLMARHDVAQLFEPAAQTGALVEVRVRQRLANDRGGRNARPLKTLFGLRVSENECTADALAPYFQTHSCNSTALSVASYPFAEVELEQIIDAIVAYSDHRGPTDQVPGKEAAQILSAISTRIDEISREGFRLVPRMPTSVAYLGRVAVRILWNIVNSRLRLDTLPAIQAAYVVSDVLTGGSREELRDWMAGRRGYVVGVGYVAIDTYLEYMEKNELTRAVLANGIFSPLLPQELGALESTYARRRRFMRNLAIGRSFEASPNAKNGVLELPGSTDYQRYISKMQARRRRRVDYRHRAKFLADNGLHDEIFVADLIPTHSHHYQFVANATATPEQRREFGAIVAADADSNEFLFSIYDTLVQQVTGSSDAATNARNDLFDLIEDSFNQIFIDIATTANDIFDQLLIKGRCRGDTDFRLGGTGVYRFGCLPFFPERLFSWFKQFPAPLPANLPYGGIFSWFIGPGYAVWPADMIKPGGDCVPERDPLQTPIQPANRNIFTSPVSYLGNFSLSNACRTPSLASQRPFCLTLNCDFCPRDFKTAAEFGFTNGWINLSVYFAALRELARISIGLPAVGGFWYLTALVYLTEFRQFLPFSYDLFVVIVIALALFGATYIAQQPELFVFQYLVWLLIRLYGVGLAWIVYFVYAANLLPVVIFSQPDVLFGSFALDVIRYLSLDQLFQWALIGIRAVIAPLFGASFDLRAALTPIIDTLGARLNYVSPTTSEVIYSLFSVYNFAELLLLLLGLAALAFVSALVASFVFSFIADFAALLIAILVAVSVLASRLRLSSTSQLSEENSEEIEAVDERLQRIEDAVRKDE